MFATFLIGTVLATCLVMVYLLAIPGDRPMRRRRQVIPLAGAIALAILMLVAAVTGLAVSA